jgi:redox-sensitive bicupin YhaK (pirin superfamily)
MIGPFVLLDHFGPARLAPGQGVEIAAHGHAHLAALTYFFSGASLHADNLGNRVVVEAGAVAWMHAGSGIVHSERTPDEWRARGGVGHGIQAWVALPEELETSPPRFQLARPTEIREVAVGGAILRVLVGQMRGVRSPIETCSPVLFVEARTARATAAIPLEPANGARAVLFVAGSGTVNGARVEAGTLVVMHDGDAPVLHLPPHAIALIFGGVSLGRRYLEGNFIASTEARLDAALRRFSSYHGPAR